MKNKTANTSTTLPKLYAIALPESKMGLLNMDPDTGDSGGEPRLLDDDSMYVTTPCFTRGIRNMIDRFVEDGHIPREGNAIHIRRGQPIANMTDDLICEKDPKRFQEIIDKHIADAKSKEVYPAQEAQALLCSTFFDDRNLGHVGTSKHVQNFGIRGAFTFGMARSVHPVDVVNYPVTRMAPDSQKELDDGKDRTMGRSGFVPYALLRHTFTFDPAVALLNAVSAEDVKNIFDAYIKMWDNIYTSTKRGINGLRDMFVCKSESPYGDISLLDFEDRLQVQLKDGVESPKSFDDFTVTFNDVGLPARVQILRLSQLRESLDCLVA